LQSTGGVGCAGVDVLCRLCATMTLLRQAMQKMIALQMEKHMPYTPAVSALSS